MSRPTYIRFDLERNESGDEITCLFCGLTECEQGFFAFGLGKTVFNGVHDKCADRHMDKIRLPTKPPDDDVG